MDKASDFGSEDCRFESCHGRSIIFFVSTNGIKLLSQSHVQMLDHRCGLRNPHPDLNIHVPGGAVPGGLCLLEPLPRALRDPGHRGQLDPGLLHAGVRPPSPLRPQSQEVRPGSHELG